MGVALAVTRSDVAGYVDALFWVYSILIIAYIVSTLFFSFGGRTPYSRPLNAVLTFLRDVSEPFLRIFRRFIPPLGPLDLSPIVALILLRVVGGVLASLIRG